MLGHSSWASCTSCPGPFGGASHSVVQVAEGADSLDFGSPTSSPSCWMSSVSSAVLSAEVESLRSLVESLRLRVIEVEERLRIVESEGAEEASESFEAVTSVSRSFQSQAVGPSSRPSTAEVLVEDSSGRAELARQIGAFLRRCKDGLPRGSSGRDRLRLQSRFYLVLADYEGVYLPEPLCLSSFAKVKRICKRGADAGRSVFVGLATKWEAKLALESGGFAVPRSWSNA